MPFDGTKGEPIDIIIKKRHWDDAQEKFIVNQVYRINNIKSRFDARIGEKSLLYDESIHNIKRVIPKNPKSLEIEWNSPAKLAKISDNFRHPQIRSKIIAGFKASEIQQSVTADRIKFINFRARSGIQLPLQFWDNNVPENVKTAPIGSLLIVPKANNKQFRGKWCLNNNGAIYVCKQLQGWVYDKNAKENDISKVALNTAKRLVEFI